MPHFLAVVVKAQEQVSCYLAQAEERRAHSTCMQGVTHSSSDEDQR